MILLETLWQDVRYAARRLRRDIGFAAAAVLALAIGIGVTTTVFTADKAMVARPLDAREPATMVNLALVRPSGIASFRFSYPDYEAYRDSLHAFSGLIAFSPERMTLSNAGSLVSERAATDASLLGRLGVLPSGSRNMEFASVFVVSENYFQVLGVAASRGRTFDTMSRADRLAAPPVLISENYWRARFAGDPSVLGKTVHLNGAAVTIVGMTPRDFVGTGMAAPDFWLPMSLDPLVHADDTWLRDREHEFCRLFGRLAPGVSLGEAQAEMSVVADRLRGLHDSQSMSAKPAAALVWPGSPFPLPLHFYAGLRLTVLLVMAAAGMVLVVACANVASLQLARAGARQHELRTRVSFGASRGRVIRQLLTESVLVAVLAGAVALPLAWALLAMSVRILARALPVDFGSLVFHVTPDLGVFGFVFSLSLAAGILFGLTPAIESSRSALPPAMRGGTAPVRTRRLQDLLITAQVALSLVLLVIGSMLIRGAIHSIRADPGYDASQIIDLELQFPEANRYTTERQRALVHDIRARVAALPGVATVTSAWPPDDSRFQTAVRPLDGARSSAGRTSSILHYTYVQADYFQTLGIPLRLGRSFQTQGDASAVMLSESAATQLWPGQNPIGRRIRLGVTDERSHDSRELVADGSTYDVIGVARDRRGVEFDGSDVAQVYLPLTGDRVDDRPLLIRTDIGAASVIKMIDPVISSVDPDVIVTSSTLDERLRQSPPLVTSSIAAAVASGLGLLGLLLVSTGIYGTVSYVVVRRTREVGIRLAVGAQKRHILGLILGESARPMLAGLLAGGCLALVISSLLRGVLYGVRTFDSLSLIGVSLLFLALTLIAAYFPAQRALRVDPVVALRSE